MPTHPTGSPKKIGPYRVTARIGEEETGVAYSGISATGETVALQLVEPESRVRFARELDTMKRVGSENVVPILAADATAKRPWLAMPFAQGPTLAEHVRWHGPLDGERLMAVAVGVAEAIAAIHRAEAVHHDLTPSNVILAPDGPKVAMPTTPGQDETPAGNVFAWASLVVFAATGAESPDPAAFLDVADPVLHEPVTGALAEDPAARPAAYELLSALVGEKGDPVLAAARLVRDSWTAVAAPPAPPRQPVRSIARPALLGGLAGSLLTALIFGAVLVGLDTAPGSAAGTDGRTPEISVHISDGVQSKVEDAFIAETATDFRGELHDVNERRFLVVRIESRNVGTDPAFMGVMMDKVGAADGKEYTTTLDGFAHILTPANDDVTILGPGETGMSTVSFLLPDYVTPTSFSLLTAESGDEDYPLPKELRVVEHWSA